MLQFCKQILQSDHHAFLHVKNVISLQDATCRSIHCDVAYRCWEGATYRCCWPPEHDHECGTPGVPYGWSVPGHDPGGVSNNEALTTVRKMCSMKKF